MSTHLTRSGDSRWTQDEHFDPRARAELERKLREEALRYEADLRELAQT